MAKCRTFSWSKKDCIFCVEISFVIGFFFVPEARAGDHEINTCNGKPDEIKKK